MSDENAPKARRRGMPLFDEATRTKIVEEALASNNMAAVAMKYHTTAHNLYRRVRVYKRRHGMPTGAAAVPSPSRGETAPQGVQDLQQEVRRLRKENRELLEIIERLHSLLKRDE